MLCLFREDDAAACCALINAGIRTMGGLNDAARAFIEAKNAPAILAPELQAFYTVAFYEKCGYHLVKPGTSRHEDEVFSFLTMKKPL